jgi:hypothetical protein
VKPGGVLAFHEVDDADDFAALPQIIQRGWASDDAVDIDTLEKRLRAATSTTRSQVSALRQVCAWVRVGPIVVNVE